MSCRWSSRRPQARGRFPLVLVLAVGVAVLTAACGGGASGLPSTPSPLPGLVRVAVVGIPPDVTVEGYSSAGGAVWMLGTGPTSADPEVLRATGGIAVLVARLPGADISGAVRDGRCYVVSSDTAGFPQPPVLRVYDARTGTLRRVVRLDRAYGAIRARLAPTGAAGDLILVLTTARGLRVGVLSAGGSLAAITRPVAAAGAANPEDPEDVALVTTVGAALRYAFLTDLRRIDLQTGMVVPVDLPSGRVVGADGPNRVLYAADGSLAAAVPADLAPALTSTSARSFVTVAGRLFALGGQQAQALQPATLRRVGPTSPVIGQLLEGSEGLTVGELVGTTFTVYGAR